MSVEERKSYVGMSTCFVCGEVKEILLDRRIKDTLPQKACYNKEPCDKCKEHTKVGVILISVKDGAEESDKNNPYRTGGWCVLKLSAAKRMFKEIPPKRIAFIEDAVWAKCGLPKEYLENRREVRK